MKAGGGHGPNLLGGRERARGGGELAPSSLGEAAGGGERRDRWRRREKRGLSPFLRASHKSFFRERAAGEIGEGASVGSCMQAVDPRPPVPKQRTRDHQKEESSAVLRTYRTTEQHESSAAYTLSPKLLPLLLGEKYIVTPTKYSRHGSRYKRQPVPELLGAGQPLLQRALRIQPGTF